MSITTQQRLDRILSEVSDRKHVTVKDLASNMAVSEATVRRDLRVLAERGELELVYGGATLPRNSAYSVRAKAQRNIEAKRIIGRLAADLVGDDEQIFLDSGTTCFESLPHLKRKQGLAIIANSARIAADVDSTRMSLIMLGGHYRADRMDTIGPLTLAALEQLRGFIAFVGADGVSMDFGVAAIDVESAQLYRLAVANARTTVLLIDHSKFQAPSLFKIVDWNAIGTVVTDQKPSPEWLDFFHRKSVKVIWE